MKDRITIVLDKDLQKQARKLQAKMIQESQTSVSFSKVISILMSEGLKKYKK